MASLLQITNIDFSALPNFFYNDGKAKRFQVGLLWTGNAAVVCGKPQLQYAPVGSGLAETVQNQEILHQDQGHEVILRPGIPATLSFRISEVSLRHNKRVGPKLGSWEEHKQFA